MLERNVDSSDDDRYNSSDVDVMIFHASDRTDGEDDEDTTTIDNETDEENHETKDSSTTGKNSLSRKETRLVGILRYVVILILFGAAISITFTVYYITRDAESDQFHSQYDGAATKVLASFGTVLEKIGATYTVGIAATIEGMNRNQGNVSWPFVTLPSYEQRAASARTLSDALLISIQPIVTASNRLQWEQSYTVSNANDWIADGLMYQKQLGMDRFDTSNRSLEDVILENYTNLPIYCTDDRTPCPYDDNSSRYYVPKWQSSPIIRDDVINEDLLSSNNYSDQVQYSIETATAVSGPYELGPPGYYNNSTDPITKWIATLRCMQTNTNVIYLGAPVSRIFLPVFASFADHTNTTSSVNKVVAVMMNVIRWRSYFFNILPDNVRGLVVVMENVCYGNVTFDVSGSQATTRGLYDGHDVHYDQYKRTTTLNGSFHIVDGTQNGIPFESRGCYYNVHVYPSQTFVDDYVTSLPYVVMCSVLLVFCFTICLFLLYNTLVEKRQKIVLASAKQSSAIVDSLFPKQVRDRLMIQQGDDDGKQSSMMTLPKTNDMTSNQIVMNGSKNQIADLFPHCTVYFADIAGFTAWSSTRGPEQVFMLLQTVYHSFDSLAKRHRVFKVETIGDCYVAATGLPVAQPNHVILMARFARDCQHRMTEVTRDLEVTLGPDCSDLMLRTGMHSGPVTAGVLQGDRARFQLFGDAVNTAARMESTGVNGKIQISSSTADLLIAAGKENWIVQRDELVKVKGKGLMKTFFLNFERKRVTSDTFSNSGTTDTTEYEKIDPEQQLLEAPERKDRFVDWITELLFKYAKLMANGARVGAGDDNVFYESSSEKICFDEIKEVIPMTRFDWNSPNVTNGDNVNNISESIYPDLKRYVGLIAALYRDNAFHSFEHACHVTMSCSKLLSRIVSPSINEQDFVPTNATQLSLSCHLHYSTFGINSDPLVQFAILFGALVHDVDHRGCSNNQLIKEEPHLGSKYRSKSVAEQNSMDIAWNLLMGDQFCNLRRELFWTNKNLMRFRSVLVNVVLATDIFDKELNDLRQKRWETSFSVGLEEQAKELQRSIANQHSNERVEYGYSLLDWKASDKWAQTLLQEDRKATIVIEHIIQASDVAHTMQHWQVYQKWNHQLFREMYLAYQSGRMAVNPVNFWYLGELQFFDNYVIPLAKKLKQCRVFGVSSDEYLDYAVKNRSEWEERGESILEELVESCR